MDLIGFIETWFQIVILDNVKLIQAKIVLYLHRRKSNQYDRYVLQVPQAQEKK